MRYSWQFKLVVSTAVLFTAAFFVTCKVRAARFVYEPGIAETVADAGRAR